MRRSWNGWSQGEKKLAPASSSSSSSNLPLCIISQQFTACPCFVCYTKREEVCCDAQHLHTRTTRLSLPPTYPSHCGKRTTSRAISGRRVPTVQTLGVIKRRWEIEIGNRGRRGGLVSCRDIEGIKNEAAAILLFSLNFVSHSTLLYKFPPALLFFDLQPSFLSSCQTLPLTTHH